MVASSGVAGRDGVLEPSGAATLSPTTCRPTRPSLMFSRVASHAPSAISQIAEPDAPKKTAAMMLRGRVASLIRLCDALGISVGSLFQAPKGEVVRRDARPRINFGGRKMTEYLLTPSGEKRVQAILSDIDPGGGSGKEPYALPAGVEFVLILAGQLHVTVAGEGIVLEEGDALTFTADMDHTFVVPPRTDRARVLWVLSPALPDPCGSRTTPAALHPPSHEPEPLIPMILKDLVLVAVPDPS